MHVGSGRLDYAGLALLAPLADIGVMPIRAHKLLSFVRQVRDEAGEPIQTRKHANAVRRTLPGFTNNRSRLAIVSDFLLGKRGMQDVAGEALSASGVFGWDGLALIDGKTRVMP